MRGLSIYIHIPFCVQKCLYCDFYSAPADAAGRQSYTDLLCREISAWGAKLQGEYYIETVFVGGGTPTCLSAPLLGQIGETLHKSFDCTRLLEFTVEANPGTVTEEHIAVLQAIGTNRISLGLQSAQENELRRLGRIHDYPQFLKTYELLRRKGIRNINIDLMAAIPGQTYESYQDTLRRVVGLEPEHISAYSLIVEESTPFAELEERGLLERPDEETDRAMYELTGEYLSSYGYERYEISNYARPGRECRHNCVYWTGGEYLGLGKNAASYLQGVRFAVPAGAKDYQKYIQGVEQEIFPEGIIKEKLERYMASVTKVDTGMQMEEFMFLGLRMMQGVSGKEFAERFGRELEQVYGNVLEPLIQQGFIAKRSPGDRFCLTGRGIDVSNQVLAEFLLDAGMETEGV